MATKKKKKLTKEEVNAIVYQDIGEVMPAPATQAEVEAVATGTVKTGSGIINLTRLSQFRQKLTLAASKITGKLDLTSQVENALPVANGGTGMSSLSGYDGYVLQVNSSGTGYDLVNPYVAQMKKAPVGTIYASYSSSSPASLFGGSWSSITGVLRGASNTSTGGTDNVTLTEAQMPSHNHTPPHDCDGIVTWNRTIPISGAIHCGGGQLAEVNGSYTTISKYTPFGNSWFKNSGSSSSHSNLPAYQNLYVWRKTAL